MRAILAILRREVQAAFVSPVAYTLMFGFLVILGAGFVLAVQFYAKMPPIVVERLQLSMRTVLIGGAMGLSTWLSIAALLCLPGLSMRLFSEERKSGTIELLLTSPVTTWQLVLGKYGGSLVLFGAMLLGTLPFVGVMAWKGQPDWGALATAYLGFLLYGAVVLAAGTLASSLTENQIVAVITTYAMVLPFFLVEFLVGLAGQPFDDVLAGLAVGVGRRAFSRGVVDSHYAFLHGALIFSFLFLSVRVIDSHRWR